MDYIELLKNRLQVTKFNKEIKISEDALLQLLKDNLAYTMAPFGMSTAQVAVLLDAKHELLWDKVIAGLSKVLAERRPEAMELMVAEIDKLKSAKGTIIIMEDNGLVAELKESYAMYAEDFANWSKEYLGKLQLNIEHSLFTTGVGVTTEHYNDLLKDQVGELIKMPKDGTLIAQMVFGGIEATEPVEKIEDVDQSLQLCK